MQNQVFPAVCVSGGISCFGEVRKKRFSPLHFLFMKVVDVSVPQVEGKNNLPLPFRGDGASQNSCWGARTWGASSQQAPLRMEGCCELAH